MMTQPLLLYHAPAAIPYPTNSADRSLLTIRFSSPVRIASIRIAPEGVLTFDNSIGYVVVWSLEQMTRLN